ncbi:MAG: carboxypeptidase regulatory-like domain-containing protein [Terriglobales bacterium]
MKNKKLILITAVTGAIFIFSRQTVHAGGGPSSSQAIAGAATVRGVVRFEGKVPAAKPINMAADPSCARQHLTPALNQEIMVGAKGGLQNVIVFVSDGLAGHTFDSPSQPAVIEQKGCLYQPHVLALRTNQQLEVVNDDPTTHNIHPMPANNREWNKAELPGTKMEEAFPRQEIAIPVKCNVHPWMHSYVAVFNHPYFVVTGKDGSFDLRNLPPGTYTVEAWHERMGTSIQKITVGANETKSIDFVFKAGAAI